MFVQCPICQQKGLIESPGTGKVAQDSIVHENENFIHFEVAGNHFLARTAENIIAELGLSDPSEKMILN